MGPGDMAGMARGSLPQGSRLDGEVGYGLPVGSRFVGTPRVGFFSSQYGRNYRVGYGLRVLDRDSVNVELGVDAQRRESPMLGGTDHGVLSQTSVGRQRANGRIPDFPVTRSHPPASWPSAANSSICRTYRKTAGEESRRRSPVANRWMRP